MMTVEDNVNSIPHFVAGKICLCVCAVTEAKKLDQCFYEKCSPCVPLEKNKNVR